MALPKMPAFTFNHVEAPTELSDTLTDTQIKEKWDSRGNELKDFIDNTIVPAAATKEELQGIVLGQIPNDSIQETKMAPDMKKDVIGGVASHGVVSAHLSDIASDADGAHGLRINNDQLEYWNGTGWVVLSALMFDPHKYKYDIYGGAYVSENFTTNYTEVINIVGEGYFHSILFSMQPSTDRTYNLIVRVTVDNQVLLETKGGKVTTSFSNSGLYQVSDFDINDVTLESTTLKNEADLPIIDIANLIRVRLDKPYLFNQNLKVEAKFTSVPASGDPVRIVMHGGVKTE
jgi:hypothetical protein